MWGGGNPTAGQISEIVSILHKYSYYTLLRLMDTFLTRCTIHQPVD